MATFWRMKIYQDFEAQNFKNVWKIWRQKLKNPTLLAQNLYKKLDFVMRQKLATFPNVYELYLK